MRGEMLGLPEMGADGALPQGPKRTAWWRWTRRGPTRTLTCPGSEPTSGQLRIHPAKVTVGEPEHKPTVTVEWIHERHEVPGARETNHK